MNTMTTPGTTGPCAEFAFDIGDYVDAALAPERARVVQSHLAGCPRCSRWCEELRRVDEALAAALPRPALSDRFAANLQAQIEHIDETRRRKAAEALSDATIEYQRMIAQLRGWRWRAVLNGVAAASVTGGAMAALHAMEPSLARGIAIDDPFVLGNVAALLGVGYAALSALWMRRFDAAPPFPPMA